MIFGKLFGKKDEEPEFFDLKVTGLKAGFIFDYDLKSWEVVEGYEYDWGNNFFTKEFKVTDGTETAFLHVEDDDELELTWCKKANLVSIDPEMKSKIINTDSPKEMIEYNGKVFYLDDESQAECRTIGEDDWSEMVSWTFVDKARTELISIERWGETDIDSATGRFIKEFEISNILPR